MLDHTRTGISHLIHLGTNHLFPVVVLREEDLQDVQQTPECLLLVEEEKCNGGDSVEALAVLDVRVVEAVGQQDSPQLGDT